MGSACRTVRKSGRSVGRLSAGDPSRRAWPPGHAVRCSSGAGLAAPAGRTPSGGAVPSGTVGGALLPGAVDARMARRVPRARSRALEDRAPRPPATGVLDRDSRRPGCSRWACWPGDSRRRPDTMLTPVRLVAARAGRPMADDLDGLDPDCARVVREFLAEGLPESHAVGSERPAARRRAVPHVRRPGDGQYP